MKASEAAFAYGSLLSAKQAVDNAYSRISLKKDLDLLSKAGREIDKVMADMHDLILKQEEKDANHSVQR